MSITDKHLELPSEKTEDDRLSNPRFVSKYGRHFAKHFLPEYCVGVKIVQQIGDIIRIVPRLSTLGKISKKTQKSFEFPLDEVENWRKNMKLHTFMAVGTNRKL